MVDAGESVDRCRFVLGEQRGEPVECGAAKAIHGDTLGMVGGHTFVPNFPTREGDLHRAGDHFCNRTPGHGGRHRCPCEATTTGSSGVPTTTPHCAGRRAVAHPRTEMVPHRTGWKCPECDEPLGREVER